MTEHEPGEIERFIQTSLRLGPAPALPAIMLFQRHPRSGLGQFVGEEGRGPFWAHAWAGGTALARYILDRPELVSGRRVVDLGTGSGLVAIAAAKAGAAAVQAIDLDPVAGVAARLNARANGVAVGVRVADLFEEPMQGAELITVGDLFYDPDVAGRLAELLCRCRASGIEVWVGDPGRRHLPTRLLARLAEYEVPDFGRRSLAPATVYAFGP